MIPVVLSGGIGTRLWPLSRASLPKQFCKLFGESLYDLTLKRLSQINSEKPWVLTAEDLRNFTEKKTDEALHARVIYEPWRKNTAAAIALLCRILEIDGRTSEIVGIFPADHWIENQEIFAQALSLAEFSARDGKLVTLGVKPQRPATGYGYIQVTAEPYNYKKNISSHAVLKFHEKPSAELAMEFIKSGDYFWNAGIFVFQASQMIEFFEKYQPQIWDFMSLLREDLKNIKDIYRELPSLSIDHAILEKLSSDDLLCIPGDFGWSDVGSWDSVSEVNRGPIENSGALSVRSQNNFVMPTDGKKQYAFVGVKDLVVVDTEDALLIAQKGETEAVKDAVELLKKKNPALTIEHVFEERPWGRFEVLNESAEAKTKRMRVLPGQQISYQAHSQREEHWIIISGQGELILEGQTRPLQRGSVVHIPQGAKHRVRNTGSVALEFIEVQLGTYFGEDDIVRFEDDYNRLLIGCTEGTA